MEEMKHIDGLTNGESVNMSELEKLAALVAEEFLTCLDQAFDRLMEPEVEADGNLAELIGKPLTRVAGRG